MIYEIETKNDLSGIVLTIRFPDKDLDRKALYTIQADRPDFLVPFSYRSVDGQAECIYHPGNRSKLQYRFGSRAPAEYAEFWKQILQPLLDCSDWFLKPFSFVMESNYLYIDKDNKTISYLYVPSIKDCEEYGALKALAIELADRNTVTDSKLENKVLRSIMQDFQPKEFLQMLRENQVLPRVGREKFQQEEAVMQEASLASPAPKPQTPDLPPAAQFKLEHGPNDIIIDLHDTDKKMQKQQKKKREKSGFFGRKKEKMSEEIILGAGANNGKKDRSPQIGQPVIEANPVCSQSVEESEETQLDTPCGAYLRLVGDPSLPRSIPVPIELKQVFTIGRFDVSVGHQESNFEFDKKTKAVSRHHAVIEREDDGGYIIVDLSSRAGTFLNGERLIPNVPRRLINGSRISFGTGGADYIWEE